MVIYSLKIASELQDKGFKIKDIGFNLKDVSKKVFVFDDSEELFLELKKYNINSEKQ